MSNSLIEVKNLSVVFDNLTVLDGVNLSIDKGQVVGIIGPSGSGKSTLIRAINRIALPTKGEVYYDGQLLTDKNINQIRQKVGMVFQQFELFPHLTVLQNIILAPVHLKLMTKAQAIEQAKHLLARVNLLDKINDYPDVLSGGQKQRIAIVRALIMNPQTLLFDEPTSALDPEMVKEVLEVIRDLTQTGMTICIVSHEMAFIKDICTRVLFVDKGKIIGDGTAQQVFEQSDNERIKEFFSKVL
ncbi:MAG: amino acid ABC transporter ATP-binding protein [Clostridia bacterium]|nr:amino acid ABC transporter ATP-binding protein [Clostridia bacterium]MBQ8504803.1 amino acid ABC transporter ATP-binding protein [Clostridia bacterium]MBQ8772242.1 amino acid ABC transporter ATP-binding protein [Clostridia bacterium]MBQ8872941.1 amino acid ABC transporter ATP-binding protein [Clostridia bacterium]